MIFFLLLVLIPVFASSDRQETAATEQSDKFSSVRETAKQIQPAQEEDEEEEDMKGDKTEAMTEENSCGSNWKRKIARGERLKGRCGETHGG